LQDPKQGPRSGGLEPLSRRLIGVTQALAMEKAAPHCQCNLTYLWWTMLSKACSSYPDCTNNNGQLIFGYSLLVLWGEKWKSSKLIWSLEHPMPLFASESSLQSLFNLTRFAVAHQSALILSGDKNGCHFPI
jgi:hypothetical protein